MRGGRLRLAKMSAPLPYAWSWPEVDVTALDPAMVIVSREPDGRWYVTFTIDTEDPEPLPPARPCSRRRPRREALRRDLGRRADRQSSAPGAQGPQALARYQRRMARCQQGSANRAKAAAKVARAHRKVRNARADFLHRASTRLVRRNDLIVIEDLARQEHGPQPVTWPARSPDCGWGEFRRQLAYKSQRYGVSLIVVSRWYPSSKTCSACGHLLAD